ncbi:MAG: hypothetical protein WDO18_03955 [Acidobacteriota bacterium]
MLRTILLVFVSAVAAWSQPLGAGLKLGVPAIDAFKVVNTQSTGSSQAFVWGPYLELRLPGGNGIEIDALRRGLDFGIFGSGSSWEFPVVIKHRIGKGLVKPYFEGGAAFSRLSDIKFTTLQHRSNYGVVVGGGVEINLLLLKLTPEIRYTGWTFRNFDGDLRTNKNQFTVLMGFGF